MRDWQEVLQHISEFRKKGLVFTNFYPNEYEMSEWIKNDDFKFLCIDDNFYFIHLNSGIHFIYFFIDTLESLEKSLNNLIKLFGNNSMAYDFILNDKNICKAIKNINFQNSFKLRTQLQRMSFVKNNREFHAEKSVLSACKNDIEKIREIFINVFDPVAERIPSNKQLSDYIERNQILVIKKGDEICGCAIIETQKKTMLLKHIVTNPKFRKMGIATKLLNHAFFLAKDCIRFILWVKKDNYAAIKMYEKFGYKTEDLVNLTFYRCGSGSEIGNMGGGIIEES